MGANVYHPLARASPTSSERLRLVVISREEDLLPLESAWSDLLQRSSTNEPMLSPAWLLPWWAVYGRNSNRRLSVGLVLDRDRLIGLIPLQYRRHWYRPGIPYRRLEWLGADVDEQDGVCSEYLNLLAERGRETEVLACLVAGLRDGDFGRWDELVLTALAADQSLTTTLIQALEQGGLQPAISPQTTAPFIPLPARWEDYLKTLAGRHRRALLKALRDFEKWADGTATFHRVSTVAELTTATELLQTLHAERWSSAGQTGVFGARRFQQFHELVLPRLFALTAVDLRWVAVRGEPLAVNYSLLWDRKVYFYQCGRRPNLPAQIRIGVVLHAHAIRAAIAAGYREYDFLGGAAQYKQQLSLTGRALIQLRVSRSLLRERALTLVRRGVDYLRQLRNSWRMQRVQASSPGGPDAAASED